MYQCRPLLHAWRVRWGLPFVTILSMSPCMCDSGNTKINTDCHILTSCWPALLPAELEPIQIQPPAPPPPPSVLLPPPAGMELGRDSPSKNYN